MSKTITPQKTELMNERKIPLSSSTVTPSIDKTMVPGRNMKFVKALSIAIKLFLVCGVLVSINMFVFSSPLEGEGGHRGAMVG